MIVTTNSRMMVTRISKRKLSKLKTVEDQRVSV